MRRMHEFRAALIVRCLKNPDCQAKYCVFRQIYRRRLTSLSSPSCHRARYHASTKHNDNSILHARPVIETREPDIENGKLPQRGNVNRVAARTGQSSKIKFLHPFPCVVLNNRCKRRSVCRNSDEKDGIRHLNRSLV